MLETQLADCQKKLSKAEKEKEVLLGRQFSLDKIKDDDAAVLFYTGFPCYEALISFYNYIEPKLSKMQYWKGENLVKESQPYQVDENKCKPGPSRKLTYLEEFLLVLMRLKPGLFVQDLADRFGISTSLVSRICITWINLLYFELKDLFPFPSQELVHKNMPKECAVPENIHTPPTEGRWKFRRGGGDQRLKFPRVVGGSSLSFFQRVANSS